MNKNQLYESIMRNVKKALNESNLSEKSVMIIDNCVSEYYNRNTLNIMMAWIFICNVDYIVFTADFYQDNKIQIYKSADINKNLLETNLYNGKCNINMYRPNDGVFKEQIYYIFNTCVKVLDNLGANTLHIITPGHNFGNAFIEPYKDKSYNGGRLNRCSPNLHIIFFSDYNYNFYTSQLKNDYINFNYFTDLYNK